MTGFGYCSARRQNHAEREHRQELQCRPQAEGLRNIVHGYSAAIGRYRDYCAPAMRMEHGLRLRPVEEGDLDLLIRVRQDPSIAGEFFWYGYSAPRAVRDRFERDGYLGDDDGLLIVDAGGEARAAGFVSWHRTTHGPGSGSRCWNMGVFLLPEHRGRGLGTEAQRRLVEYLFATTPVVRVEAGTDINNLAEQRSLDKAGFTREGVLRRAQFRNGDWHDVVIYSRLRDEEA